MTSHQTEELFYITSFIRTRNLELSLYQKDSLNHQGKVHMLSTHCTKGMNRLMKIKLHKGSWSPFPRTLSTLIMKYGI
uniref:Uncharacterized protein n=1 Tax=Manihot esculenta TaxID=3983 RepID=A0A2C9WD38_MANES